MLFSGVGYKQDLKVTRTFALRLGLNNDSIGSALAWYPVRSRFFCIAVEVNFDELALPSSPSVPN
jgi:hypothetical protein